MKKANSHFTSQLSNNLQTLLKCSSGGKPESAKVLRQCSPSSLTKNRFGTEISLRVRLTFYFFINVPHATNLQFSLICFLNERSCWISFSCCSWAQILQFFMQTKSRQKKKSVEDFQVRKTGLGFQEIFCAI